MERRCSRRSSSADPYLKNYKLVRNIGEGAFGKVKLAMHRLTGLKVAIKILNRRGVGKKNMDEKVKREIKVGKLLVHPDVIRLYEVIETTTYIYVVMEYAERGDSFDYIVLNRRIEEDEARKIFQQLISGIEYCDNNSIAYQDLKPENLLLDSNGNLKIANFGLCYFIRDGYFLKTTCGSRTYAAPERGVYTLPSHLTPGARDMIGRMLVVEPLKRITIPEIRQHHWFQVNLPRYLAAALPDITHHMNKIDEEVLERVVTLGYNRKFLVQSLQSGMGEDVLII